MLTLKVSCPYGIRVRKINLVLNGKPIRKQDFKILIDFQTLMSVGN
jgi:hypothetical protein